MTFLSSGRTVRKKKKQEEQKLKVKPLPSTYQRTELKFYKKKSMKPMTCSLQQKEEEFLTKQKSTQSEDQRIITPTNSTQDPANPTDEKTTHCGQHLLHYFSEY